MKRYFKKILVVPYGISMRRQGTMRRMRSYVARRLERMEGEK